MLTCLLPILGRFHNDFDYKSDQGLGRGSNVGVTSRRDMFIPLILH